MKNKETSGKNIENTKPKAWKNMENIENHENMEKNNDK